MIIKALKTTQKKLTMKKEENYKFFQTVESKVESRYIINNFITIKIDG